MFRALGMAGIKPAVTVKSDWTPLSPKPNYAKGAVVRSQSRYFIGIKNASYTLEQSSFFRETTSFVETSVEAGMLLKNRVVSPNFSV